MRTTWSSSAPIISVVLPRRRNPPVLANRVARNSSSRSASTTASASSFWTTPIMSFFIEPSPECACPRLQMRGSCRNILLHFTASIIASGTTGGASSSTLRGQPRRDPGDFRLGVIAFEHQVVMIVIGEDDSDAHVRMPPDPERLDLARFVAPELPACAGQVVSGQVGSGEAQADRSI